MRRTKIPAAICSGGARNMFLRIARFQLPAALLLAGILSASAQEGVIDEMANDSAAVARITQEDEPDYTYKNGNFKLLVLPELDFSWNDNINLTKDNTEDDFIITPLVGLTASYPLTERNLFSVNFTLGYNEYIEHGNLSSFYLQSGSGISFDFSIKDITFNLHDQFSYEQDSAQNAQIAGTGQYGSFQNSVGLSVNWSFLKNMTMTVGYDHQNTISTSSQFQNTDQSSEVAYASLGYVLNSKLTVGVDGSGSFTLYDQNSLTNSLNNNSSCSIGVYADFQPDSYFHLQPRFGYTFYLFQHTSQSVQTSDSGTWYADLNISHQVTKTINYSIDVGHEATLGVQSDLNEDWYVRPNINWNFIKGYTFQTSLYYEHGNSGEGNVFGNLVETYDWYGGSLTLNHAITSQLTLGLNYRFTQRLSSIGSRGYIQNVVGLQLTYHPL